MITLYEAYTEDTLCINASGPELVRARDIGTQFLVETFSAVRAEWIVQKEHKHAVDAMADCSNWYPS